MLIIETDGITHYAEDSQASDNRRDIELREVGFTTLRFSDWEVLNRLTDVSEIISAWILDFVCFRSGLKNGINPKIVSERLGHSSVVITLDIYSHVLPGLQEEGLRRPAKQLSIQAD